MITTDRGSVDAAVAIAAARTGAEVVRALYGQRLIRATRPGDALVGEESGQASIVPSIAEKVGVAAARQRSDPVRPSLRSSDTAGIRRADQVRCDLVALRAIRGATGVDEDTREQISGRTAELVVEVLRRNRLAPDDVVSMFLTATPDLRAAFPAAAVREAGITDVPLMCAQELDVEGAMPRVIRLMAHVDTTKERAAMRHVYLHGTDALRDDLDHEDGR